MKDTKRSLKDHASTRARDNWSRAINAVRKQSILKKMKGMVRKQEALNDVLPIISRVSNASEEMHDAIEYTINFGAEIEDFRPFYHFITTVDSVASNIKDVENVDVHLEQIHRMDAIMGRLESKIETLQIEASSRVALDMEVEEKQREKALESKEVQNEEVLKMILAAEERQQGDVESWDWLDQDKGTAAGDGQQENCCDLDQQMERPPKSSSSCSSMEEKLLQAKREKEELEQRIRELTRAQEESKTTERKASSTKKKRTVETTTPAPPPPPLSDEDEDEDVALQTALAMSMEDSGTDLFSSGGARSLGVGTYYPRDCSLDEELARQMQKQWHEEENQ